MFLWFWRVLLYPIAPNCTHTDNFFFRKLDRDKRAIPLVLAGAAVSPKVFWLLVAAFGFFAVATANIKISSRPRPRRPKG